MVSVKKKNFQTGARIKIDEYFSPNCPYSISLSLCNDIIRHMWIICTYIQINIFFSSHNRNLFELYEFRVGTNDDLKMNVWREG